MAANGIAQAVLFSCLLMAASVWDLRKRTIPDSICLLIALTGLIDFSPVNCLGILAALPLLIAALRKPDGVGGGDIKLTAAAGIVLGFWGCMAGLIFGLTASLFFYLSAQTIRRLRKLKLQKAAQTALPMAPFLSLGFHDVELVVVGGESDRDARPLDYDWVLDIREQCKRQDVHFEFRQCGTHFIKDGKQYSLAVKDLCAQARKANIIL